ncbi:hypothetical protein B484DRAFT_287679 [Ochromonadaceae sp. CCMP2298]|nr:hypothetical protein B484DRAFT_287679 [Ochromonadaceae sp. CCMP2298]
MKKTPIPGITSPGRPVMRYSAAYDEGLSLRIRHSVIALQLPPVQRFLRLYTAKITRRLTRFKFDQWLFAVCNLRAIDEMLLHQHTNAAVVVQRRARGLAGRARAAVIREGRGGKVEHKMYRAARIIQVMLRLRRMARIRKMVASGILIERLSASIVIQKTFRGYLSRGLTIALEKLKLIKQLRKWSHGVSNRLLNLNALQNGHSQAVLYAAIYVTTLPSRPLRDLPPLRSVRTVRRSLYLLYWQLETHYSAMRLEYKNRTTERRLFHLEDLTSNLLVVVEQGRRMHLLRELQGEQQKAERYEAELAHRAAHSKHMLLMDNRSKELNIERMAAERQLQLGYKERLSNTAAYLKVFDDLKQERELMQVEEVQVRYVLRHEKAVSLEYALVRSQVALVDDAVRTGAILYAGGSYSLTAERSFLEELGLRAVGKWVGGQGGVGEGGARFASQIAPGPIVRIKAGPIVRSANHLRGNNTTTTNNNNPPNTPSTPIPPLTKPS